MKTKFLSLKIWGGQIKFAFLLLLSSVLYYSDVSSQYILETIEGESLWRFQGYGVSNHSFDIKNYIIPLTTEYVLNPDPITASCPNEIYTTDDMPLYDDEDEEANTLKIRPSSANNYADYTNGVNTSDLLAISRHYQDITHFEDLQPYEDAPFRYISADADYDHDVDADDNDMIVDLLLGIRYDLERNSWEWVHKDEIEEAEERFEETPYEFVIDYNWPGSEGIILAALTTDEIQADNDKFFTFRTTKIGDIVANSGWTTSSANTWVCGSGTYATTNTLESRSTDLNFLRKIKNGSVVTIRVTVHSLEEIFAYQLPIHFSEDDFELTHCVFQEGYFPRWNFNEAIQSLILLDFSRTTESLPITPVFTMEFILKAKQDVELTTNSIKWSDKRMLEITGNNGSIEDTDISLEIIDITPSSMYVEARANHGTPCAYIESDKDQAIHLRLVNSQGITIRAEYIHIFKGENIIPYSSDFTPGIYYIHAIGDYHNSTASFIVY